MPSQVPGPHRHREMRGLPRRHPRRQRRRVHRWARDGYTDDLADIRTGPGRPDAHLRLHRRPSPPCAPCTAFRRSSPAHWTRRRSPHAAERHGTLHWVELERRRHRYAGAHRRQALRHRARPSATTASRSCTSPATSLIDGRLDTGPADLYTDPLRHPRGRRGHAARRAPRTPRATEYYPAFSPDDSSIAFTRVAGAGIGVQQPGRRGLRRSRSTAGRAARPFASPPTTPPLASRRLASPGLTNDWPKWSPRATVGGDGRTYYWLTFSSKRTGSTNAQLYVTAIVIASHPASSPTIPALYLWNQPAGDGNHTPSWDDFALPPIVIGFGRAEAGAQHPRPRRPNET